VYLPQQQLLVDGHHWLLPVLLVCHVVQVSGGFSSSQKVDCINVQFSSSALHSGRRMVMGSTCCIALRHGITIH
jgi:hypothetical protein